MEVIQSLQLHSVNVGGDGAVAVPIAAAVVCANSAGAVGFVLW